MRQGRIREAGAGLLQFRQGFAHPFRHPGIAIGEIPFADANPEVRDICTRQHLEEIFDIATDHRVDGGEPVCEIGDTPRERSGRIERRHQRDDPIDWPAPRRGPHARIARHGGGHPHRPGGVRADRKERGALAEADTRTGTRPRRRTMLDSIPGIARRAPVAVRTHAAKSELDRVGLAGNHAKLLPDRRNNRTVHRPVIRQLARTAGKDRIARDADQILDRNGNALQRTEIDAGGECSVGGGGLRTNLFRHPCLVGVQRFAAFVVIADHPVGDLHRRELAVAKFRRNIDERSRCQIQCHFALSPNWALFFHHMPDDSHMTLPWFETPGNTGGIWHSLIAVSLRQQQRAATRHRQAHVQPERNAGREKRNQPIKLPVPGAGARSADRSG